MENINFLNAFDFLFENFENSKKELKEYLNFDNSKNNVDYFTFDFANNILTYNYFVKLLQNGKLIKYVKNSQDFKISKNLISAFFYYGIKQKLADIKSISQTDKDGSYINYSEEKLLELLNNKFNDFANAFENDTFNVRKAGLGGAKIAAAISRATLETLATARKNKVAKKTALLIFATNQNLVDLVYDLNDEDFEKFLKENNL